MSQTRHVLRKHLCDIVDEVIGDRPDSDYGMSLTAANNLCGRLQDRITRALPLYSFPVRSYRAVVATQQVDKDDELVVIDGVGPRSSGMSKLELALQQATGGGDGSGPRVFPLLPVVYGHPCTRRENFIAICEMKEEKRKIRASLSALGIASDSDEVADVEVAALVVYFETDRDLKGLLGGIEGYSTSRSDDRKTVLKSYIIGVALAAAQDVTDKGATLEVFNDATNAWEPVG